MSRAGMSHGHSASCERGHQHMEQLAHNFSRSLGWQHGKFGIFANNYQRVKTRFMFLRVCELARQGRVRSMCELGFNAGLSALLLLEAAPGATLVSFDLGDLAPNATAAQLKAWYPQRFLGLQLGKSQVTLPRYFRDSPSFRCDVAFVDGDKSFRGRVADLRNLRKAVGSRGTRLFFDEVTAQQCLNGSVSTDPEKDPSSTWKQECQDLNHAPGFAEAARVYDKLSREGQIQITECDWPRHLRDKDGICTGELIAAPARD